MEREFGLIHHSQSYDKNYKYIGCSLDYLPEMEKNILRLQSDRIVTIGKIVDADIDAGAEQGYKMKEAGCDCQTYSDEMIECLAIDYVEPEPIKNRWQILDLRG